MDKIFVDRVLEDDVPCAATMGKSPLAMGKGARFKPGTLAENLDRRIPLLRGQRVMPGADLAALHGVRTTRLNEPVKRNRGRFPTDFMFRLTAKGKKQVVANCGHQEGGICDSGDSD